MSYRQAFSAFYARNFERRPWITLAVTNGTLGVIADGAAQTLERISQTQQSRPREEESAKDRLVEATEAWDWSRSGRFLAFNVGMAPLLAEWNRFLEFRFPLRSATAATTAAGAGTAAALGKVSLRALGSRVGMDQLLL